MNIIELFIVFSAILLDLFIIVDMKKRIKENVIEMPEYLAIKSFLGGAAYLFLTLLAIHIDIAFIPDIILFLAGSIFVIATLYDIIKNNERTRNTPLYKSKQKKDIHEK